jgi:16S rRNA (guanine527-N7)-methyltransferase
MKLLESGAQKLGIKLTPAQLERFETYYREMVDWNARMNLTAITDYEEVQLKHFLDSLTVISALGPRDRDRSLTVIDVGAGAGFPGLPLKLVFPQINLSLLEATTKKARFLEHMVNVLRVNDVNIINARAEDAAHNERYREKFEVVLARAVAGLPALLELTLPFCAAGGRFIAMKKGNIEGEIKESQKALEILGGKLSEIRLVVLEELGDDRVLVICEKTRSTPPGYPRRAGIPSKKPLSG